jgi:hypothetical protein
MLRNLVAVILLALAIVGGWALLHPITLPKPRSLHVQEEEWHLPERSKLDIDPLVESIEKNQLWGTSGPPVDEKPLTSPNWRITGVLSVGTEHYALIEIKDQPILQLKTGEELPGGAKILSITADRLCISLNGKKRVLKTYKE